MAGCPKNQKSPPPAMAPVAGKVFAITELDINDVVTIDMGGTSFDVVYSPSKGKRYLREPIVERYEIATPMCQLFTIGAGGGSIAWVDEITKTLHVGPQSAESVPGPICYGLGGTEPTVTDADVVLNRIPFDHFIGGRRRLKREEALTAIKENIAAPLRLDVYRAAEAICKIVDGTMQAEMKRVIANQGIDSSKCLLFAYGGAGPAHCAYFSDGLFQKVVVPPMASTFCAFGASTTDISHRYAASCFSWFSALPYNQITLRFSLEEINLEQIPPEIIERFNKTFENLELKAGYKELGGSAPDCRFLLNDHPSSPGAPAWWPGRCGIGRSNIGRFQQARFSGGERQ